MGVGVNNGHGGARLQGPPERILTGCLRQRPPSSYHRPSRDTSLFLLLPPPPFLALQSQLRSSRNKLCPRGSNAQRTQGVPGLSTLSLCTRRCHRGGV